jgi:hypothetical protein
MKENEAPGKEKRRENENPRGTKTRMEKKVGGKQKGDETKSPREMKGQRNAEFI